MADELTLAAPIIVGLLGVLFAVLDRGWKRFKEEQSQNPDLKFGGAYLLNFLVASGIGSTVVIAVVPAVIAGVGTVEAPAGLAALTILQGVFGYTTAYTILSKANTSTEHKIELVQAKKILGEAKSELDPTDDRTRLIGKSHPQPDEK